MSFFTKGFDFLSKGISEAKKDLFGSTSPKSLPAKQETAPSGIGGGLDGTAKAGTASYGKVIILGSEGSGKTALTAWLAGKEHPIPGAYEPTVGVEFSEARCAVAGRVWNLQLWDSAGKRGYGISPKVLHEGAALVVVVLDLAAEGGSNTLAEAKQHVADVTKYARMELPVLVVGNKADAERKLPKEDVADFICSRAHISYIELHAHDDEDLRMAAISLMVQNVASSRIRVDR